jgi:flagellar motor component MotA
VLAIREDKTQVMAGIVNGNIVFTPFANAVKENSKIGGDMLEMIRVLAV